jgi:hypothetical protein
VPWVCGKIKPLHRSACAGTGLLLTAMAAIPTKAIADKITEIPVVRFIISLSQTFFYIKKIVAG